MVGVIVDDGVVVVGDGVVVGGDGVVDDVGISLVVVGVIG